MKIFLYLQFVFLGLISFVPTLLKPDSLLAQSSIQEITSENIQIIDTRPAYIKLLAKLPEDLSLAIPLGCNYPIKLGTQGNSETSACGFTIAIGYISSTGSVYNIRASDLIAMFEEESRTSGMIYPNKESVKISQGVIVIDLLVIDKEMKRKIIRDVRLSAFSRYCLNAVLTENLYKLDPNDDAIHKVSF